MHRVESKFLNFALKLTFRFRNFALKLKNDQLGETNTIETFLKLDFLPESGNFDPLNFRTYFILRKLNIVENRSYVFIVNMVESVLF